MRIAIAALAGALDAAKAESPDAVKTRYRLAHVYLSYTTDTVTAARHLQLAVRAAQGTDSALFR